LRRIPIIKRFAGFDGHAAEQFTIAVGNVDVSGRMVANPPLENITAASGFAQTRESFYRCEWFLTN
jgi:hypothetical protein